METEIYYPYLRASKYGRAIELKPVISSPKHNTSDFTDVTDIEAIVAYNDEKDEVTLFAVNRKLEEDIVLESNIRSFGEYGVIEHIVLQNSYMKSFVEFCKIR